MLWTCVKCTTPYPPDILLCPHCGTAQDSLPPPNPGRAIAEAREPIEKPSKAYPAAPSRSGSDL